ncbi:MAG: ribosomal RNA small subunit methyltransferase A [Clostridia bacterium]|nr:ribosomal RNA small subunit methyltransferase A [Clostridia bacterium]
MAYNAGQIKEILSNAGRRANRALGQNFCTDTELLSRCVKAAGFSENSRVLEIGPGLGALTRELLAAGASVTAVEKDGFLADLLPELLPDSRLTVYHEDILRFPISEHVDPPFSVAGNLPYYITTPIVERMLPLFPDVMLFMVQKEASARFFASPGERVYGPLSIMTRCFYRCEVLADVPPDRFYPSPDVASAFVLLRRADPARSFPDGARYLRFLHSAFSKRRKTLTNNITDPGLPAVMNTLGIPLSVRAEALSPEQFLSLYALYAETAAPRSADT